MWRHRAPHPAGNLPAANGAVNSGARLILAPGKA